jgi:hypothetical protein
MEQSPSSEANRFVASQETPLILLNPKFHYRIHNCPPTVSILSQPNPVHTPTSHFLKIHPNIILPHTPVAKERNKYVQKFEEVGMDPQFQSAMCIVHYVIKLCNRTLVKVNESRSSSEYQTCI